MAKLNERGEGGWKVIAFMAVLMYGFVSGVKLIPPWMSDKEFAQKTMETLKFAGTNYRNHDQMVGDLQLLARQLDIPIDPEEIKILDDEDKECPPGQPGAVYMKLLQDFKYKGDEKKTQEGRRGEFFTVGDVGTLDEEGYLFLCDRKIDMIISGGVNIYPAEVESVLFAHPKVGDAAVFGIPDEDWGEQVKAVVEPAPGVSEGPDLEREILDFCAERLAKYKCPRSIEFTDALPRDPNGKLYKRKLRDPYWKGRTRSI